MLVANDHGFFATDHVIHVNFALPALQLVRLEGKTVAAKDAWSLLQSEAAAVNIQKDEGRAETPRRIKETMAMGTGARPSSSRRSSPDLWLAAKEGDSFTNDATGEAVVAASKPAGTHGYLPDHPGMRGIFVA